MGKWGKKSKTKVLLELETMNTWQPPRMYVITAKTLGNGYTDEEEETSNKRRERKRATEENRARYGQRPVQVARNHVVDDDDRAAKGDL